MGWTEQRTDWDAKLLLVKAWPLSNFLAKERDWNRWESCSPHWKNRKRIACQQDRPLQVSLPLRIGMGSGIGGIDSGSLVLRLIQVKSGCCSSYCAEESAMRDNSARQGGHRLGRKLETAGNVMNAASILLLSQAFCGPVVTMAMTCMATVGFTRFAIGKIFDLLSVRPKVQHQFEGLLEQVHEFSTASLLLSIGVPILKRQSPALHNTLECLGAAIPVALGYAETTAKVKGAPVGGAGIGEHLWRERHRWAACRLCRYLTDFRHPPKVGWLMDIWERTSLTIIPNMPADKTWIIGSIHLPLRLYSDGIADHERAYLKAKSQVKQWPYVSNTVEHLDTPRGGHTVSQEEQYGQMVVSSWNEGVDDSFLEFSAVQSSWRRFQQKSSLVLRGCYLLLVFGPLIVFGPVIYFLSTCLVVTWGMKFRTVLWWLLRFCLEKGGAAFIKWGQWSATREDLFPADLCNCLGRLHDQAPEHSYAETRKAVLMNLGRSIEDIFEDFPLKPCASGSIAQVYKATLKDRREGMPAEVAVKVRHPSVGLRIYQDFQIMAVLANWAQELPALRWLKLRESVDQFSHTLTAQADLRVEAENLARFHRNFETLNQTIIFPKLIPDLVSEGVIVEGFERGLALHQFLKNRTVLNTQIAAAGVDAYLKMLLIDNFVHIDLHPGNILARSVDDGQGLQQKLQLILLDFGLAEELTPTVRYHFLSFIMMIGASNGKRAAYHLLQFSWPHQQRCRNPDLLVEDMEYLFAQECHIQCCPIDLNKVLIKVLQLCRRHEVTIDSAYASLLVAVCVLVGFAQSLDPEMSIMDAAVPCLFLYNLTGRILGRIYG